MTRSDLLLLTVLGIGLVRCPSTADVDLDAPAEASRSEGSPTGLAGPAAGWTIRRGPMAVANHPAGGRLFVFSGQASLDRSLPGVVEDAAGRGPAFGLLSGYFAPRLLADNTTTAADLQVVGDDLRVEMRGLSLRALAPREGRLPLVLRGGGTLAFAADRTEIQGLFNRRPSFALVVSAGAPPSYRGFRADTLLIRTRTEQRYVLETDCDRLLLVHPLPRGSTSVFLLHVGPRPPPVNPVFMPAEPIPPEILTEQSRCASTATSTLTIAMP